MTVEEFFKILISEVGANVSDLGFVRNGSLLRLIKDRNCALVEFQKSTKSTKDAIIFSINLAVVVGDLLQGVELSKVRSTDGHIRERLGMLLPERSDKWWEINSNTDVKELSSEISAAINEKAIPYLRQYLDNSEVITLWESGRSPGLTKGQRSRLLEKLKSKV